MLRIGIAASKMSKGCLSSYNLYVILISCLISLFIFFISGFSILLFIFLIVQMARIIRQVSDPFGKLICIGVVTMIAFSTVVNIGVSIGSLPTKGLPLPFISYGGSSLIFDMVSLGILINIARTGEYP